MASRWDTLQVDGDAMRVYVATPDYAGPKPAIVVAQNAGGVGFFIQETVDRLAAAGYVAAAPDLYHRQKDTILDEVAKLPSGHPDRVPMTLSKGQKMRDAEILADVDATIRHLRSFHDPEITRLGIVGFCQGGRTTFLVASHRRDVDAAALFYGAGITMARGDDPPPLAAAASIQCPMIGFFGEEDRNPSPEHVAAIEAELRRLGKSFAFHSYAGAGHAFLEQNNPTLPGVYREDAAKDAFAKVMAFFEAHLMAPTSQAAR